MSAQVNLMILIMMMIVGSLLLIINYHRKSLPVYLGISKSLLGIMLAMLVMAPNLWARGTVDNVIYVKKTCPSSGDGTTTTCGATGPYKTIQEAVEEAMTNNLGGKHDVIKIMGTTGDSMSDRTYYESVGIRYDNEQDAEDGLTLIPYAGGIPVLNKNRFYPSNSFIASNTWFNDNFPIIINNTARNSNAAIPLVSTIAAGFAVSDSNTIKGINLTIKNLQIKGYNVGIFIKGRPTQIGIWDAAEGGYDNSGQFIRNCRVNGFGQSKDAQGHGIAVWGGASPKIKQCDVSSNYDGIAVSDNGSSPKIESCFIYLNARNGVAARSSASPLIGGYGPGKKNWESNEIFANYIGVGCRDNASPTVRNNNIRGDFEDFAIASYTWITSTNPALTNGPGVKDRILDQYNHPHFDPNYYSQTNPSNMQLGVGARDSSTPWIYGNLITRMKWGAIVGSDQASLSIGNAADGPRIGTDGDTYAYKHMNRVFINNMEIFEGDGNKCNLNMPIDGRASIGIRDNSRAWIFNNLIREGNVGVGARDFSTLQVSCNTVYNNVRGIAMSEINPSNGISTYVQSNSVHHNILDGIVCRDSGAANQRILIAGNNIHDNGTTVEGVGIGIDHSFVSIMNNDLHGNGDAGEFRGSAGIGIRNMSDVIIVRNRIFNNIGLGCVVTGSTVTVIENLIAENVGSTAAQLWIADGSTAKKINNNVIIGNYYEMAQYDQYSINSYTVEISNLSVAEEIKDNIFYGFGVSRVLRGLLPQANLSRQAAIVVYDESLGEILPGAVDNNIAATYVYSGTNPTDCGAHVNESSCEADTNPKPDYTVNCVWDSVNTVCEKNPVLGAGGVWKYEVTLNEAYFLWNSEIGTFYPGPNTQMYGAMAAGEKIFKEVGDTGVPSRNWELNPSSPVYSLSNYILSEDYIGLPSNFDYGLANSVSYNRAHDLSADGASLGSDTNPTELRTVANILMPGSSPLPNDSLQGNNAKIETMIMDNGDGIVKSLLNWGFMTANNASAVNVVLNGVVQTGFESMVTISPDIATASNYRLSFEPTSTFSFDNVLDSSILVSAEASDGTANSKHTYSLTLEPVFGGDSDAPTLTRIKPFPGEGTISNQSYVSFYLEDIVTGVDLSTVKITLSNGTTDVTLGSNTGNYDYLASDYLRNNDIHKLLFTFKPNQGDFLSYSDGFDYSEDITVNASMSDYAGLSGTGSFNFRTTADITPPEDVTLLEGEADSSGSLKFTWNPSVNSEGDLKRILVSLCLEETLTNCSLYSGPGWTNVGTLSNTDVSGAIIGDLADTEVTIDDLDPTLEDEFYWVMLETEDETGSRLDFSEIFTNTNYGVGSGIEKWTNANGKVVWREDSGYDSDGLPTCTFTFDNVNENIYVGANDSEGQMVINDYAPANFMYEAKITVTGDGVGYMMFRHNVNGDFGAMFADGLNSGYVAYIKAGEAGLKIVPDAFSKEGQDCNIYSDNTWLSTNPPSTVVNITSPFKPIIAGQTYLLRVVAIEHKLALEMFENDENGTFIGKTPPVSNKRYTFGEIGIYRGNEGGTVTYDDIYVNWLGVVGPLNLVREGLQLAGGFFHDDFNGFSDDFTSGSLSPKWVESGLSGFQVSSNTLTTGNSAGELLAFDFNPGDRFKITATTRLTADNDEANIVFNKQSGSGIGRNSFIAHLKRHSTAGEISLIRAAGGVASDSIIASQFNIETGDGADDWNLTISMDKGIMEFNATNGTSTYNVNANNLDFLDGMVGILQESGTSAVEYTSFSVNDLIKENWDTDASGTTQWDISQNQGVNPAPAGKDVMMAARGFVMPPSFAYAADVTLESSAYVYVMFQKNNQNSLTNMESYALKLSDSKIDTHVSLVKLDSDGTEVSLLNSVVYSIDPGTTVHVGIKGTSSYMQCDTSENCTAGNYAFRAYLSTLSNPYSYEVSFSGVDSAGDNLLTKGRAGFGVVTGSSYGVTVDNVVLGKLAPFQLIDSPIGSTFPVGNSTGDDYASIQDQISSANAYAAANPDEAAIVVLECGASGNYDIGNNIITMLNKVGLVGGGMDCTTISGTNDIIHINKVSQDNTIAKLTLKGAQYPDQIGIFMVDTSPLIEEIRIRDFHDGIRIGGGLHIPDEEELTANISAPTITLCEIIENTHIGIGNNVASGAWIYKNYLDENDYVGIGAKDMAEPRIEENRIGSSGLLTSYRHTTFDNIALTLVNNTPGSNRVWSPGNGNLGIGTLDYSSPYVLRNTIANNAVAGIGARGNSSPWISDNVIYSNGNFGIFGYEDSNPTVRRNRISSHWEAGIAFWSETNTVTPEILHNRLERNRNGIRMQGGVTGSIKDNYVCSSYGTGMLKEGGIMLKNWANTLTVTNDYIDDVFASVTCDNLKTAFTGNTDCETFGYDLTLCVDDDIISSSYTQYDSCGSDYFVMDNNCSLDNNNENDCTLANSGYCLWNSGEGTCGNSYADPCLGDVICARDGSGGTIGNCIHAIACNTYGEDTLCDDDVNCLWDTDVNSCKDKYACRYTYQIRPTVEHSPAMTITNNWIFNGKSNGIGFRDIQERATGYKDIKPVYAEWVKNNNVYSNVFRGIGVGVEDEASGRNRDSNNSANYSISNNWVRDNGRAGIAMKFVNGAEMVLHGNTANNNTNGIVVKYARGTGSLKISGNYIYNNEFTRTNYIEDSVIYTERTDGLAGGIALLNPGNNGLAINITGNYLESNVGWVYSEGNVYSRDYDNTYIGTQGPYFKAGGIGIRLTDTSLTTSTYYKLDVAGKLSITNNIVVSNKGHSIGIRGGRQERSSIVNAYIYGNTIRNATNSVENKKAACAIGFRDQAMGTIENNTILNSDHAMGFDDLTFTNNSFPGAPVALVKGNYVDAYADRGIGLGIFRNNRINGKFRIQDNTFKNGTNGSGIAISAAAGIITIQNNVICSNVNTSTVGHEKGVSGGIGIINLSSINNDVRAIVLINGNSIRNNSGEYSGGIGITLSNKSDAAIDITISSNYLFSNVATKSINFGNGAGIGIRETSATVSIINNIIRNHR